MFELRRKTAFAICAVMITTCALAQSCGTGDDPVPDPDPIVVPDPDPEPDPEPDQEIDEVYSSTVFNMNEDGSRYYRIPAIAVAPDGSLVALADKRGDSLNDLPNIISVVARRSTDGGKTWSPSVVVAQGNAATGATYGDPAIICDSRHNALVAIFSGDTGFFTSTLSKPDAFYMSRSYDNGVTWETPRNISSQLFRGNWHGSFCASGSMCLTSSGTILFVANTRTSARQGLHDIYEYVCASSDGGETWSVLNPEAKVPSDGLGNESKILELSDGRLLMSIRSRGARRFSFSSDGGRTWSADEVVSDLVEPDCNGDIIRFKYKDNEFLLHSLPADPSTRRNVTVYVSADNGKSWTKGYNVTEASSAYSAMTQLPDGSLGVLYELGKWDSNIDGVDGFTIEFVRIPAKMLID